MTLPALGKIFWICGTGCGDSKDCVDWATMALCSGADSPSLRILAGLDPQSNGFEIRDYTRKALEELGIKPLSGVESVLAYARDLAEEIVENSQKLRANLNTLYQLCHTNDYLAELHDFYLLDCAYTDFDHQDVQYYWQGATKENIEAIAIQACQDYISRYEPLVEHDAAE